MGRNECVYLILIADNCVDKIDQTIESMLNQSYKKNFRIIVADNASTDGTYEKVLSYLKDYSEYFSIYRMSERLRYPRVFQKVIEVMRKIPNAKYSGVFFPGDILKEYCLERVMNSFSCFDNENITHLICEMSYDVSKKDIDEQKFLMDKDTVIRGKDHFHIYAIKGIGHEARIFYNNFCTLFDYIDLEELNMFFRFPTVDRLTYNIIRGKEINAIYLRESLLHVDAKKILKPLVELMDIYEILKNKLYYKQEEHFNEDINERNMLLSCQALSEKSLECGEEALYAGDVSNVRQYLIFAEMVYSNIVSTERYQNLNEKILKNG